MSSAVTLDSASELGIDRVSPSAIAIGIDMPTGDSSILVCVFRYADWSLNDIMWRLDYKKMNK